MTDRGVMTRDEEEADGAGPSAHAALRRSNRLRQRVMPSPEIVSAALSAGRRRAQARAALNRPAGTTPHERVSSAALVRHETLASHQFGAASSTPNTTHTHRMEELVRPSAEGESKEVEIKIEAKVAEQALPGSGHLQNATVGTLASSPPSSALEEGGALRPATNTPARGAGEGELGAPDMIASGHEVAFHSPWAERAGASGWESRLRAADIAQVDRAIALSLMTTKHGDDDPFLIEGGRRTRGSEAPAPDAQVKPERTGIGPVSDATRRNPRISRTHVHHDRIKMEHQSSSFAARSSHSGEEPAEAGGELLETPTGTPAASQEYQAPTASGVQHGTSHVSSVHSDFRECENTWRKYRDGERGMASHIVRYKRNRERGAREASADMPNHGPAGTPHTHISARVPAHDTPAGRHGMEHERAGAEPRPEPGLEQPLLKQNFGREERQPWVSPPAHADAPTPASFSRSGSCVTGVAATPVSVAPIKFPSLSSASPLKRRAFVRKWEAVMRRVQELRDQGVPVVMRSFRTCFSSRLLRKLADRVFRVKSSAHIPMSALSAWLYEEGKWKRKDSDVLSLSGLKMNLSETDAETRCMDYFDEYLHRLRKANVFRPEKIAVRELQRGVQPACCTPIASQEFDERRSDSF